MYVSLCVNPDCQSLVDLINMLLTTQNNVHCHTVALAFAKLQHTKIKLPWLTQNISGCSKKNNLVDTHAKQAVTVDHASMYHALESILNSQKLRRLQTRDLLTLVCHMQDEVDKDW